MFRAARGGGSPGVRTPHGPGGRDGRAEVQGDQGQPRPGHHLEEGGESGGEGGRVIQLLYRLGSKAN